MPIEDGPARPAHLAGSGTLTPVPGRPEDLLEEHLRLHRGLRVSRTTAAALWEKLGTAEALSMGLVASVRGRDPQGTSVKEIRVTAEEAHTAVEEA